MGRRPRSEAERTTDRLAAHRFGEAVTSLAIDESFTARPMFGCLACYLRGRLVLVLADRGKPWCGVLVPTEREHQAALRDRVARLRPHPVLTKWLFLDAAGDTFDADLDRLVTMTRAGHPAIGVEPQPKRVRGAGRGGSTPGRRTAART